MDRLGHIFFMLLFGSRYWNIFSRKDAKIAKRSSLLGGLCVFASAKICKSGLLERTVQLYFYYLTQRRNGATQQS